MPTVAEILKRAREGKNLKVPPVADAIGLSANGIYTAIRRGDIASVRVGKAIMIPGREVLRLLAADERPAA